MPKGAVMGFRGSGWGEAANVSEAWSQCGGTAKGKLGRGTDAEFSQWLERSQRMWRGWLCNRLPHFLKLIYSGLIFLFFCFITGKSLAFCLPDNPTLLIWTLGTFFPFPKIYLMLTLLLISSVAKLNFSHLDLCCFQPCLKLVTGSYFLRDVSCNQKALSFNWTSMEIILRVFPPLFFFITLQHGFLFWCFFRNGTFGDCLVICDVLRAMTLSFHRGFPSLTKVNSLPRPLVPSSPSYPLSLLLVSCLTITHSPSPMFPSHNIIDSLSLLVLLCPELSSSFLPVVVKSLQQIVSLIVSPLQSYYPLKIPRPCWPMASWSSKSIHFPDFVLLNLWVAFGIVDPPHSSRISSPSSGFPSWK